MRVDGLVARGPVGSRPGRTHLPRLISCRGRKRGDYDDSGFYMSEQEERSDGSRLFRFVGGDASSRGRGADRRVHFVGIGGAGLSSLASLALKQGWRVTGSDVRRSAKLAQLEAQGAVVSVGHSESNLFAGAAAGGGLPDAVVLSSAINCGENVEVLGALKRSVPLYKRQAWIARVTTGHRLVAVAGTHGKTTTSAMVALIMEALHGSVTAVIGGDCDQFEGVSSMHGSSPWFVLEADEYDRAFLDYRPEWAIVTSCELDHLDVYASAEECERAFQDFLADCVDRHAGGALVCGDDEGCANVMRGLAEAGPVRGVHTYGLAPGNDWRATCVEFSSSGPPSTSFDVEYRGSTVGRVTTGLLGAHNVLNALSAVALCSMVAVSERGGKGRWQGLGALQATVRACAEVLEGFGGVRRRCQVMGSGRGWTVLSDYAHHPTEIDATLRAIRQHHAGGQVWLVLEPHTRSRVSHFLQGFARACSVADKVFIGPLFEPLGQSSEGEEQGLFALPKEHAGGLEAGLASAVEATAPATSAPTWAELLQSVSKELVESCRAGAGEHVVVFMGAGLSHKSASQLLDLL